MRFLAAACALLLTSHLAAQPTFHDDLRRARSLKPVEACNALEPLHDRYTTEQERREVLRALKDKLPAGASPLNPGEERVINDLKLRSLAIGDILVGRYAITIATPEFARRAQSSNYVLNLDLSYLALKDMFGNDPIARIGRRFIIFPDKDKPGGHTCNGRELIVQVGRADADNAEWLEQFVHELTHGFQFAHPASRSLFMEGFFEGWAEFAKAFTADRLAFLGPPFQGFFDVKAKGFVAGGENEYVNTRLPIEEIVPYDPAAGLLTELVLTTRKNGHVNWQPYRRLFRESFDQRFESPWHRWPVLMAHRFLGAFDPAKARRTLQKYRVPCDDASIAAVKLSLDGKPDPGSQSCAWISEWRVAGPLPNASNMGLDWDPLDIENISRDSSVLDAAPAAKGSSWRSEKADDRATVWLSREHSNQSQFYYLSAHVTEPRGPVTLFISSDDDCLVFIDGELVHMFRGNRGVAPDLPDVSFAHITGPGLIAVLVVNHGGPAAFMMGIAADSPYATSYPAAVKVGSPADRSAVVRYLGSRRGPLATPLLIDALNDAEPSVRAAAAWGLGARRRDPDVVEALIARLARESPATNIAILDALEELTFERFENAAAAKRWWDKRRSRYVASGIVEAETALGHRTMLGGFFGNLAGAYAGQCLNRGWGSDRNHWAGLTIESGGTNTFAFRYTAAEADRTIKVRVRRGVETVFEREGVTVPKTTDWSDWHWLRLGIPPLPPGRYHVEILEPSGPICLDVVGLLAD
jgi:hypothetical protein